MKKLIKGLDGIEVTSIREDELILKANEALIAPLVAGICRTDRYVGEGRIPSSIDNITLGHECVALVLESKSERVKKNDLVVIHPLFQDGSFLGIDHHGCFTDRLVVNANCLHVLPSDIDLRLGAYIEPIAASLAPLKIFKKMNNLESKKIAIWGNNRIAKLTGRILELENIEFEYVDFSTTKENYFDIIIETKQESSVFNAILQLLKRDAVFIVKSRNPNPISINFYEWVKKDITFKTCYYYDFQESIKFAEKFGEEFTSIFSEEFFSLKEWKKAFELDNLGKHKIFFKINKKEDLI